MKLEFLVGGSPDCPLMRLYDFTPDEAAHLHAALTDLASGAIRHLAVHALPYVEAIDGCQLKLRAIPWDQAMFRCTSANEYECGFTCGTWDNIAGLVEPFVRVSSGHQWLAGSPGEAPLLLSVDGSW